MVAAIWAKATMLDPQEDTMTTTAAHVVARYTTTSAERMLIAQPTDAGRLRVEDHPASGEGPVLEVEPALEAGAPLEALVCDYLALAARLDQPPMRGWL